MDERAYYNEGNATKPARLQCPFCRTTESYDLRWLVRKKKDRLPPGGDDRDRAKFAKAHEENLTRLYEGLGYSDLAQEGCKHLVSSTGARVRDVLTGLRSHLDCPMCGKPSSREFLLKEFEAKKK